ncbi:hypothetical protein D3C84_1041830 [compost metagenome]
MVYTIIVQQMVFAIDVFHKINFGSPISMGVFGENFILILNQIMNLNMVTYRAEENGHIVNLCTDVLQSTFSSNHTGSTAKAHGIPLLKVLP